MTTKFMNLKKFHEVDIFSKTVNWLLDNEFSIIIDAGAGKGHAAFHLCKFYKLNVLAIESSQIKCHSAIARSQTIEQGHLDSKNFVS